MRAANGIKESEPKGDAARAPNPQRAKALEAALSQIERQFGRGAIMRMNEATRMAVQCVSTGSLSLDLALGGGGVPRGRIVEIFGPESSGKTTLTSHLVAEIQKAGGTAAFIDAEHAYDPAYGKKIGVNTDELLISQPDSGEQALQIAEMLVASNSVDIVVVDSVAALVPKAELEGEIGDSFVGLQARLMSQALRKLTGAVSRSDTLICFTNQIREKIGVMFGSPETQPGGRALKFYASVRIDLRRIGQIKDRDEVVGNRVKATVVKNKIAPPFRKCEFDILFNQGISREGDAIDLAILHRVIEKSGSWLSYNGERLGQGRDRAKALLLENPDLLKKVEADVRAAAMAGTAVAPAAGGSETPDFGGGDGAAE